MKLLRGGLKKLSLKQYSGKTDGAGGVSYHAGGPAVEFYGKIQPAAVLSEYSFAGFTYTADYVMLTDAELNARELDCVSDGTADYIITGIKNYDEHAEYALEKRVGKGAFV